jgi:hypothetical protein
MISNIYNTKANPGLCALANNGVRGNPDPANETSENIRVRETFPGPAERNSGNKNPEN